MRKILALLLIVIGLNLVGPVAPANAVAGCNSLVQDRYDSWVYTAFWHDPLDPSPIPRYREIRLVANLGYQFCPDGSAVNKLRPKKITWCYTFMDGGKGGFSFNGVKFNAFIFDDNETSNPATFEVYDSGTDHACNVQFIADFREKWLDMGQSPGWTVTGWIDTNNFPNDEFTFRNPANASRIKYFHPDNDPATSGWYR